MTKQTVNTSDFYSVYRSQVDSYKESNNSKLVTHTDYVISLVDNTMQQIIQRNLSKIRSNTK